MELDEVDWPGRDLGPMKGGQLRTPKILEAPISPGIL